MEVQVFKCDYNKYNRSMKGVKINNYIDNRIVVSDPKINN